MSVRACWLAGLAVAVAVTVAVAEAVAVAVIVVVHVGVTVGLYGCNGGCGYGCNVLENGWRYRYSNAFNSQSVYMVLNQTHWKRKLHTFGNGRVYRIQI